VRLLPCPGSRRGEGHRCDGVTLALEGMEGLHRFAGGGTSGHESRPLLKSGGIPPATEQASGGCALPAARPARAQGTPRGRQQRLPGGETANNKNSLCPASGNTDLE
jgi:hypothetical protein